MVLYQLNIFFIFIFDGIIVGIIFDIFRILRKLFKTSDVATYIEDIMFWIFTGLLLLFSIFKFCEGEVRFYMFVATFFGFLIYIFLFSKHIIHIFVNFNKFLTNIILKFIKKFKIHIN